MDKRVKLGEKECSLMLIPVKDALEVLAGKWKLQIIIALTFGKKRFKEIAREIGGISDKMLSKELKEMERHQLIVRTVYDAFPPVVEYELTPHGKTLHKLIDSLRAWGNIHRKKI
ncbi:MAG: helix-turn-helix transcriptional regulator, partial [Bacteroidetes bacterium]|nr:helix-turn-helix transcriptional regulator [Bacteroidota bacterium]